MHKVAGKMRFPEPARFVVERVKDAIDLNHAASSLKRQRTYARVDFTPDSVLAGLRIARERRDGGKQNPARIQPRTKRGDEGTVLSNPCIQRRGVRGHHWAQDVVHADEHGNNVGPFVKDFLHIPEFSAGVVAESGGARLLLRLNPRRQMPSAEAQRDHLGIACAVHARDAVREAVPIPTVTHGKPLVGERIPKYHDAVSPADSKRLHSASCVAVALRKICGRIRREHLVRELAPVFLGRRISGKAARRQSVAHAFKNTALMLSVDVSAEAESALRGIL